MIDLTQGRGRGCKDSIAGLDIIYFSSFVDYDRSEIIIDGATLTSFPGTFIYEFKVLNANFSESQTEEDGGKSWSQSLSFDLPKINLESNLELIKLVNKDHIVLVKDRNGFFRLMGLFNGITTELTKTTGSSKGEFSGYKLTIDATEELSAVFVEDLNDAGFIVVPPDGVVPSINYIFQDGDNFIFQDGNNYIYN